MSDEAQNNLSGSTKKERGKAETVRFLVFSLCKEDYAVPLLKVKEVIALTEVTPVPYAPPHFKGIMNLRGQVISVIDLRHKFKMSKPEITAETAIIILDISSLSIGVIVDSVESVLALQLSDIQPPPDVESQMKNDYIIGVTRKDKKLVLLLDIEQTLNVEELKTIKQQQQQAKAS